MFVFNFIKDMFEVDVDGNIIFYFGLNFLEDELFLWI